MDECHMMMDRALRLVIANEEFMTSRQVARHRPIILVPMVFHLSGLRFQADFQNQLVHTIEDFLRALRTFGTHISEMLTLAIFNCNADELIVDPALRADCLLYTSDAADDV